MVQRHMETSAQAGDAWLSQTTAEQLLKDLPQAQALAQMFREDREIEELDELSGIMRNSSSEAVGKGGNLLTTGTTEVEELAEDSAGISIEELLADPRTG
eukprot:2793662-Prymnesium_polylepis.1